MASTEMGKRSIEAMGKYMAEHFVTSYACVAMAYVLNDMGLPGCGEWFSQLAESSRKRAMDLLNYFAIRRVKIKLPPIPATKQDWRAPLHILEEMERRQRQLSGLVALLQESSLADKDYVTNQFVFRFLREEMEQEYIITTTINRFRKMQTSDMGILQFDNELLQKTEKK
ncbi:MAG: hypothetical protein IJA14_01595 [Alphaproteobacteria bacterium]|nr:hypothetical protein [Alphaproteobacteria bacterium]